MSFDAGTKWPGMCMSITSNKKTLGQNLLWSGYFVVKGVPRNTTQQRNKHSASTPNPTDDFHTHEVGREKSGIKD